MVCLDKQLPPLYDMKQQRDAPWLQVTESCDMSDILCVKWTHSLLVGSSVAAAVVVKGKGMFELVDVNYGSSFLALDDEFSKSVVTFAQYGRYYRFWVDLFGNVRVLLVAPQRVPRHPEWRDLLKSRAGLVRLRMLASRVGYFINDITEDSAERLSAAYTVRKKRLMQSLLSASASAYATVSQPPAMYLPSPKLHDLDGPPHECLLLAITTAEAAQPLVSVPVPAGGVVCCAASISATCTAVVASASTQARDASWVLQQGGRGHARCFAGFHLYRCWQCHMVLLKPLRCHSCMAAVYCSKDCQREHWQQHQHYCQRKHKDQVSF
eukprot:TRINITY_DN1318_c0_g1_i2.p1 TRINITY_DN1318_c0_g1~~TRINITY_DN1318_c0_g1_i2.p1  ORF type:complete len:324 (-),score=74.86 TRINITY_DN1318_c0_g1_i2:170-1141(-)